MENDEGIRVLRICENCGDEITDEQEEYYVNDDGEAFCCIECLCGYYEVTKIEI